MEFGDLPLDLKKFTMHAQETSGHSVHTAVSDALHWATDSQDFMNRALTAILAIRSEVNGALEALQTFGFER
jgi:methyl-accepting chemotaxis protein